MGIESDFSESDETKPLVGGAKTKKTVMPTVSNASNQSGSSDVAEDPDSEKSAAHMPEEYKRMYLKALKWIDVNIPSLISGGSSGSYLIHGESAEEILGVFKPEDEEPYGINNPKWGKWFQKVFLPCTFGRGCLVPNQGYVSEAAAFIVDEFFKLNVVPATAVVGMASKVFNYSKIQRYQARAKQRITGGFPDLRNRFNWSKIYKKKMGSFQTFVHGFMDPEEFMRLYPIDSLSEAEKQQLTVEIQKMFVLDYIIRNTDRLNANYLIKVTDLEAPIIPKTKDEAKEVIIDIVSENEPCSSETHNQILIKTDSGENFTAQQGQIFPAPIVHAETLPESHLISLNIADTQGTSTSEEKPSRIFEIACIDNGLAFPFKHPSDIRSYPFSWSKYFPYFANQPFVPEIKELLLSILQNIDSVKLLCEKVQAQLKIDKRYRQKKTIKSQMNVFRGQMYNLLKALENNLTPAHLETKKSYYAKEIKKKKRSPRNRGPSQTGDAVQVEISSDDESADSASYPKTPAVELWRANFKIRRHTTNPYFSCL